MQEYKRLNSSIFFQRAIVWDVKKGKKHAELGWESNTGVKYAFKVKVYQFIFCSNSSWKVQSHNPPYTSHISFLAIIHILPRGWSLVVWRETRGSTRCTPSAIRLGRARWEDMLNMNYPLKFWFTPVCRCLQCCTDGTPSPTQWRVKLPGLINRYFELGKVITNIKWSVKGETQSCFTAKGCPILHWQSVITAPLWALAQCLR